MWEERARGSEKVAENMLNVAPIIPTNGPIARMAPMTTPAIRSFRFMGDGYTAAPFVASAAFFAGRALDLASGNPKPMRE